MDARTVALSADHAGVELKRSIRALLEEREIRVLDLGTDGPDSVDYPDMADRLAEALVDGRAALGVLVCGTGIGIAMRANRHPGIRAAVCHDVTTTRLARRHNDANVLALGARVLGPEVALDCMRAFLDTDFEGGRHQRRVDKLE
jgi:ribose 5-phosphate isomerase B